MTRILALSTAIVLFLVVSAGAQPPGRQPGGPPGSGFPGGPGRNISNANVVARMMAFDKNKDGKLAREEITDARLLRLFDRADANHDKVVTKEELTALVEKADAEASQGNSRGPDGPGPGPEGRGPAERGGGNPPPKPGPRRAP